MYFHICANPTELTTNLLFTLTRVTNKLVSDPKSPPQLRQDALILMLNAAGQTALQLAVFAECTVIPRLSANMEQESQKQKEEKRWWWNGRYVSRSFRKLEILKIRNLALEMWIRLMKWGKCTWRSWRMKSIGDPFWWWSTLSQRSSQALRNIRRLLSTQQPLQCVSFEISLFQLCLYSLFCSYISVWDSVGTQTGR